VWGSHYFRLNFFTNIYFYCRETMKSAENTFFILCTAWVGSLSSGSQFRNWFTIDQRDWLKLTYQEGPTSGPEAQEQTKPRSGFQDRFPESCRNLRYIQHVGQLNHQDWQMYSFLSEKFPTWTSETIKAGPF
jgi:hypothetical protein